MPAKRKSNTQRIEVPYKLVPIFRDGPRYKAIHGGRASAKSTTAATAAVVRAHIQPTRFLYCREFQNSIRESSKKLLETTIRRLGLMDWFTVTRDAIIHQNGSEFVFRGLHHNIDSIRSLEGINVAVIEEAHTISSDSLRILKPTIREPGSELWFVWNRHRATDPVDAMFLGPAGPPPDAWVEQINYLENPWVSAETIADANWDRQRDVELYNHVWLGEPIKVTSAQVFRSWSIGRPESIPPHARTYWGADWGFSEDPSVLIRLHVWDRTVYVDRCRYRAGVDLDELPEFFGSVDGARDAEIRADSSRPDTIRYMQRHGFPRMVPCRKGSGSVDDGVAWLKSHHIVVDPAPECRPVVIELGAYSYKVDHRKVDPQTGEPQVTSDLVDAHNHAIDAMRYATECERGPVRIIGAMPGVIGG